MQIKSALPEFLFTGNYWSINCPVPVYLSVLCVSTARQPVSTAVNFCKCWTVNLNDLCISKMHHSESNSLFCDQNSFFWSVVFITFDRFWKPFSHECPMLNEGYFSRFIYFFSVCQSQFCSVRLIWAFSLSHREAGMRLRRSIICCSSALLCAVFASSASAWSIAGLLWTVVELCSSVGCFHTPSIIHFSTTDPLFCTKTTLSRYEGETWWP